MVNTPLSIGLPRSFSDFSPLSSTGGVSLFVCVSLVSLSISLARFPFRLSCLFVSPFLSLSVVGSCLPLRVPSSLSDVPAANPRRSPLHLKSNELLVGYIIKRSDATSARVRQCVRVTARNTLRVARFYRTFSLPFFFLFSFFRFFSFFFSVFFLVFFPLPIRVK